MRLKHSHALKELHFKSTDEKGTFILNDGFINLLAKSQQNISLYRQNVMFSNLNPNVSV